MSGGARTGTPSLVALQTTPARWVGVRRNAWHDEYWSSEWTGNGAGASKRTTVRSSPPTVARDTRRERRADDGRPRRLWVLLGSREAHPAALTPRTLRATGRSPVGCSSSGSPGVFSTSHDRPRFLADRAAASTARASAGHLIARLPRASRDGLRPAHPDRPGP